MKTLYEIDRELLEEDIREMVDAADDLEPAYRELQYRGLLPASMEEAAPFDGQLGLKSAKNMSEDELKSGILDALGEMNEEDMSEFRRYFSGPEGSFHKKITAPILSEQITDYQVKAIFCIALGFIGLAGLIILKIILKS